MSARRCAGKDYFRCVDVVILGVIDKPTQAAATILNRRRSKRVTSEAVFHIYHGPTHRKIRKQIKNISLLCSINPTASVKENECRVWLGQVFRQIEVELKIGPISRGVRYVRLNIVITRNVIGPVVGGLPRSSTIS